MNDKQNAPSNLCENCFFAPAGYGYSSKLNASVVLLFERPAVDIRFDAPSRHPQKEILVREHATKPFFQLFTRNSSPSRKNLQTLLSFSLFYCSFVHLIHK